jgi:hypothetical protein
VTPNNVTIDAYGLGVLEVEPALIYVPKLLEDRWYLVQLGDYYDEIFQNIGGTKGQQPGVYVVTGPDFAGPVPGEMMQLRSRTKWCAVGVRIFVNGESDLPNAVETQRGFQLMPLSYLAHGLAYDAPKPAGLDAAPADSARRGSLFRGTWPLDAAVATGGGRRIGHARLVVSSDRPQRRKGI